METTETTTAEVKKTAYELACEKLSRTPLTIENFSHEVEANRRSVYGKHKHDTCTEAANIDAEGKLYVPDFTDGTEKHFPYYIAEKDSKRPAGVGFRFDGTFYDFGLTYLGSRLGYSRTREIAREIGMNAEITEYQNEAMGV